LHLAQTPYFISQIVQIHHHLALVILHLAQTTYFISQIVQIHHQSSCFGKQSSKVYVLRQRVKSATCLHDQNLPPLPNPPLKVLLSGVAAQKICTFPHEFKTHWFPLLFMAVANQLSPPDKVLPNHNNLVHQIKSSQITTEHMGLEQIPQQCCHSQWSERWSQGQCTGIQMWRAQPWPVLLSRSRSLCSTLAEHRHRNPGLSMCFWNTDYSDVRGAVAFHVLLKHRSQCH